MRQIVYVSTVCDGFTQADMDQILASSQRNNPTRGLTGLLLWNGRNFLQLLEGPRAELLSLLSRLAQDPRHAGIARLEDLAIEAPDCPEWAMERIYLAADVDERRSHLEARLPATLDAGVRRTILNFAALN